MVASAFVHVGKKVFKCIKFLAELKEAVHDMQ